MLQRLLFTLAQEMPWDDPPDSSPPAPAGRPANVHDLQKGFQQWYSGGTNENSFRNGALCILAVVAILAIIIHLRQRRKHKKIPDSQFRLSLELCRVVPFPFGTRLLLWWVARSTSHSMATLLISAHAFESALESWSTQPTLHLIRRWGRPRLQLLHTILFTPAPAASS